MKKDAIKAVKRIKSLGYCLAGVDGRGRQTYRHGSGHEVVIAQNADGGAILALREIEKRLGLADNKPDVNKIKARHARAAEREAAERARMQARTDEILVARTAALARQSSAACTGEEWRAIARQIEEYDREARELRGLMSAPAPREARVHHRNGSGEAA